MFVRYLQKPSDGNFGFGRSQSPQALCHPSSSWNSCNGSSPHFWDMMNAATALSISLHPVHCPTPCPTLRPCCRCPCPTSLTLSMIACNANWVSATCLSYGPSTSAGPRTYPQVWVLGGAGADHTVGIQEPSCIISSSST